MTGLCYGMWQDYILLCDGQDYIMVCDKTMLYEVYLGTVPTGSKELSVEVVMALSSNWKTFLLAHKYYHFTD